MRVELSLLSADDSAALAKFFEYLEEDAETCRFFHPHPLTGEFAKKLCARGSELRDRYYVARWSGEIVGYCMLRGWDEGYAIPSFGGCVHPEWRNKGVGKALMLGAIAEARSAGAPALRLSVYKENERAISVYRRFGFTFQEKNSDELIGLLDLAKGNENNQ